ncbi:phage-related protein [Psychrobacillus insolitus]|uniref:Phage-related protein n=1 Tax=Psychrobacillus insolitus TaxID=1461 RepID=A0A2W7PHU3_9BACI|nr:hypothetical protein [Psychrobacillus insolitus]PZX07896.1 phage-related protein [Psychrobacillus insolitus]
MTVERFSAIVGANVREFKRKMREVDQTIRSTASGTVVNIGAQIAEFHRKYTVVRNRLLDIARNSWDANIGADTAEFYAKIALLRAKALALARNKIVIPIRAAFSGFREGWQVYQQTIGKIASNIRSVGEIIGNTFLGVFISLIPALAPIIASIGGLIGSLGPVIGTVAGSAFALVGAFAAAGFGAGAFAAVAITNLKGVFAASSDLKKLQEKLDDATTLKERTEIMKEMEAVQGSLNSEQTKALDSMGRLKGIWKGITDGLQTQTLQIFTKALDIFGATLETLKPLFEKSTAAVDGLMTSLGTSMKSPPIQEFLKYLNTSGGPMLTTFGQAFGNIFAGIASMLTAFGPLSADTAKGFLGMTQTFADWAAGLGKSEKFQAFVDYVKTNMPKIKSIVGDAITGLVDFFAAFGPIASDMMSSLQDMMGRFKEWSSTLSSNKGFQEFIAYVKESAPKVMELIGNLTDFLINLGIGMAPLGGKIMEVANSFFTWVNGMMQGNPIIGKIIAVVVFLGGILIAFVPHIIAFGAVFLQMLPHISKFGTFISGLWAKLAPLGTTILNLASRALPWLLRGFAALTGPVGIVIAIIAALIAIGVYLWKNWDTISAKALELKDWVVAKFTELKDAAIAKFTELKTATINKFTELKTAAQNKVSELKTAAITKFTELKTGAVNKFTELKTAAINKFTELKTGAVNKATELKTAAVNKFTELKTAATNKVTELKTSAVNKFNELKTAAVNKVSELKTAAVTKFAELKTAAQNKVSEMKTVVQNKFTEMKDAVRNKMNEVKTKVEEGWNKAKAFLTSIDLTSIGKAIIQGLIRGIGSMAGSIASKVSEMADLVPDWLKKKLGIHSPSRITTALGEHTGQGFANGIANKAKSAIDAVKGISSDITSAFVPTLAADLLSPSANITEKRSINASVSHDVNSQSNVMSALLAEIAEAIKNGQEITLNLDGHPLAKILKPYIDAMQSQDMSNVNYMNGVRK